MTDRTIRVDYLARVEGEGAVTIRFKDGQAEEVRLEIFEPPRFFEAFLRGRTQMEVPDITARICGICPVAYMMSACQAIEDALEVTVDPGIARLRRLLYCGEWIESHSLHVFLLHAPDFLGFQDAIEMAKTHPEIVRGGLRTKKAGNAIVSTLGGREVHPVNVKVGGFYRTPRAADLTALLPELRWARDHSLEMLDWTKTVTFPDLERDYEFVALRHPDEYPICDGRLVSSRGLDIAVREYEQHFEERQVSYSNALHSERRGYGAYFCGPLARFNLNADRLSTLASGAAERAGLTVPCRNPFKSLLARLVEIVQATDEAIGLIETYAPLGRPAVELPKRAAIGHGCTEAPRGILYHRYAVDEAGVIQDARIVPPTSQNQGVIEADLRDLAPRLATLPHDAATWLAEQAIRNYDPCISCATHFLTLRLEHE